MSEISYLPGAEREHQERTLDQFAAAAVEAGWIIHRRGTTYVQAVRTEANGRVSQVSLSLIDGQVRASRVEVITVTSLASKAFDWLAE